MLLSKPAFSCRIFTKQVVEDLFPLASILSHFLLLLAFLAFFANHVCSFSEIIISPIF